MRTTLRLSLLLLITTALAACGGSSDSNEPEPIIACNETGEYACKTGATEPLYTFQWALNYAQSYFNDFPDTFGGGIDLNVEPVHREGIKGQGVNVLVVDTGADLHNEDLAPNADFSMSWNFVTNQSDPYPATRSIDEDPHGTNVAGIIGAAQNNKGVMGIAPRITLGATNLLQNQSYSAISAALGGAPWSSKAHIINASYGNSNFARPYDSEEDSTTPLLRALKKLRDGKGIIYMKAAGNDFDHKLCGLSFAYYDCTNPSNDGMTRDPNSIVVAALNAFGHSSSYSSAGSVLWVTGMGGEYGSAGNYGEGKASNYSGPTLFTTDMSGCSVGYSWSDAETPFLRGQTRRDGVPDNPNCDYSYMNGTSAAAPSLSGVVALMLSANPALTWLDVRDILRLSARKVDTDYVHASPGGNIPYGALTNLRDNTLLPIVGSVAQIHSGSTAVPIDLGWQKNAAGNEYSNWYGFGVPDAAKAVKLAKEYKEDPQRSRTNDVQIPAFQKIAYWQLTDQDIPYDVIGSAKVQTSPFPYQKVSQIGTLKSPPQTVDTFQVRLSGENVCLGSLGVAVISPSGTASLLKLPNDHFRATGVSSFEHYGLSSMAFYGEPAQGEWQIFALAANPDLPLEIKMPTETKPKMATPCPSLDEQGLPVDYQFGVEARIITQ